MIKHSISRMKPGNLLTPIRCTVWLVLFFFTLHLPVASALYEATKGSLPIPGSGGKTSESLTLDQDGIILSNDQISLRWQSDGNLVLYYCGKEVVWNSNTDGKGHKLAFQTSDGMLVIKDSSGKIIWSSGKSGGQKLQLRADRNLVILNNSDQVIWQSQTAIAKMHTNDTYIVGAAVEAPQDFLVPDNPGFQYLALTVKGADGGNRHVKEAWGDTRFKVKGGGGATIRGIFEIGHGGNMIPPGSTVRVIVGKKGTTRTMQSVSGCMGGGGTAVFVQKPNNPQWHMLVVAGGGGGAYSDCCTVKSEGKSAETGQDGSSGQWDTDDHAGGKNGDPGEGPCAGGGAFGRSLDYPYAAWPGGDTDPTALPIGWKYRAGQYDGNTDDSDGTWGFGGGGKQGTTEGSGGGGYSGGGNGGTAGGGGGGSYVNPDMAISEIRLKNGGTNDPKDGFVQYQFTDESTFTKNIKLAKNQTKCIENPGEDLSNGNNIQLWGCQSGNQNQQWFLDGMVLRAAKSVTKCLDLKENKEIGGTNIQLYDCNGSGAQKWIYDGVTQKIRLAENWAYCLDLYQGSDNSGTNVQLGVCDGIDGGGLGPGVPPAQQWIIDGASTPDMSTKVKTIRPAGYTDKCIENANGGLSNGTNIQWGICQSGIQYQQWKLDGETIKPAGHPNKCVDLTSSNTADGTNIQLYECNGTDAQKWIYDGMIQAFRSGVNPDKCLSHWLPSPIQNITLSDCNGSAFQRFVIE